MKSLSPLKEIGAAPRPGYNNPRFWTPEKKTPDVPPGGFTSIINTGAPFDQADIRRILDVQGQKPTYGTDSGKQSIRSLNRSFQDMSRNALGTAQDEFSQKLRAQAEKAQGEEVLSQRQTAQDKFQMDRNFESFVRNTWQRLQQGYKDLAQYAMEEQKNASARFWSSFLGSL